MIETLMGLPGRVTALLGRLTETRAGNLDRLDAAISTRAQQSTALTNLVWTDAIAVKLASMHVETPPTALPAPWELPSGVVFAGSETALEVGSSWDMAYTRTGAGSLRMLAFKGIEGIRITIDGVVALSRDGVFSGSDKYAIWGHLSDGNVLSADTPLPFSESILIEARDTSSFGEPQRLYHVIVGT